MIAAILAVCIAAGEPATPMPEMNEFIVTSMIEGLRGDAFPRELAWQLVGHDEDFVEKCRLCIAARDGIHRYANSAGESTGSKLDGEFLKQLQDKNPKIRQSALRDLIQDYIDRGYQRFHFSAEHRKAMQAKIDAERKVSMSVKPEALDYCPSCDGLSCRAPADSSIGWGTAKDGRSSRLTAVTRNPLLGQPLRVRLEIKNVSERPIRFDDQQAAVNGSLEIRGPDGIGIPYIGTSFQTFGVETELKPGDAKTIFADLDISGKYLVDRPGAYTIRFRGRSGIPESNELQVKVRPGQLPDFDRVFTSLYRATPAGWRATRYDNSISFLHLPTTLKADAESITVYFTAGKQSGLRVGDAAPKYLGEMTLGHAWLVAQSPRAMERWPDYANVISERMKPFLK